MATRQMGIFTGPLMGVQVRDIIPITWVGSSDFVPGRWGRKPAAVVFYFSEELAHQAAHSECGHYGISREGAIFQYIKDEDSLRTPGLVCKPKWSKLIPGLSPGVYTIFVEEEGRPSDGLTNEQYEATLFLTRTLCNKWGIFPDREHLIGRHQLDSVKWNGNPGQHFPWIQLLRDLNRFTPVLSAKGSPGMLDLLFTNTPATLMELVNAAPGKVEAACRAGFLGRGLCWYRGRKLQRVSGDNWPVLLVRNSAVRITYEAAVEQWPTATFALAAGPVLYRATEGYLPEGVPSSFLLLQKSLERPRTGIGIFPDGSLLLAAVGKMTLEAWAEWFAEQGCAQALNLDGGPGTAFYFGERVIVYGSKAQAFIPNAIALLGQTPTNPSFSS